jgi:2-polyprenyl-3-methyl-5-hydroxy-6-metoxy-1,4-benzoquinol methylase
MPTSDPSNLSFIMKHVLYLKPKSVLDLGIGMGKYGALCREYLDVWGGTVDKSQWNTTIHGVEGFEQYRNPMWELYNDVTIGDFTRDYESYTGYDLVLMIDSLEHVDKETGKVILHTLRMNNKNVIVSCPDGDYEQGAVHGNEFERHRSVWRGDELRKLGGNILFRGECSVAVFGKA